MRVRTRGFKGDLYGPKNFESFWLRVKDSQAVKLKIWLKADLIPICKYKDYFKDTKQYCLENSSYNKLINFD